MRLLQGTFKKCLAVLFILFRVLCQQKQTVQLINLQKFYIRGTFFLEIP